MAKKKILPDTVKKWQRVVSKCKLEQETIHGATLASASKIILEQFLLFRVLVKECKNHRDVITMLGIENLVKQATTMLDGLESCNTYCNNFWPLDNIAEGTFAVARESQLEVQQAPAGKDDDDLLGTPVQFKSREGRARKQAIEALVSSMTNVHLGSPAEKGKGSANVQPGSDAEKDNNVTSAGADSAAEEVKESSNVHESSAKENKKIRIT
ncbi:hypothetical protein BDW69DRAFT_57346 [Aspergillus filifer]